MTRERWLILYCIIGGVLGWGWLLASGPGATPLPTLVLFLLLALLVESAGFRVPPADPHSLVGIVLLTAALALGPADGALVAALSGALFGVVAPLIYHRRRSVYLLLARPLLRSGVRAAAILGSAALAAAAGRAGDPVALLVALLIVFPLVIQSSRALREYLQGGRSGVATWWHSAWRSSLIAEVAPLPVVWLALAVYQRLGTFYFIQGGAALLATSLAVRRAAINLQRQRRSVRELALLNEVSRAIIRAEMDVTALCDLIYRETSKVVDTSSFHLGLFALGSNQYTLVVRVQDRVRLPPLVVELPEGNGIIGWLRKTGQALLVDDFAEEMGRLPARPSYQSDRPPRSGIYVPLSAGEQVIGSISIQSYRPRAFGVDDLRILSLIADQAAVAIAKARAFDQARLRAVQLQAIHELSQRITAILDLDELLPSVVGLICERFGYHPVHIFTMEAGRLVFRATTAGGSELERLRRLQLHPGEGIVGASARQGRPLLVNDVREDTRYISDDPNTRAELAVPLRFGEECLGVLDVQSTEPGRFSEADLFVMQTLAGQIAVAIESARTFTAQREEAWTLNALLQVAENLAGASSLDELLPATVRLPALLLGCQRCYCLEWRPQAAGYMPLAAYGLGGHGQLLGQFIPEQQAPLLAEARRAAAPLVRQGLGVELAQQLPALAPIGAGTLLVVPLTARGATLGLLVADFDPAQTLSPRIQTLCAGMANQIAGALEGARLAQEAAEAAHLEEELRVAREIQTALLPAMPPRLDGWQIAADWRSARLVGGDFYDFWPLRPLDPTAGATPLPSLGFVIADVSDKGVPAAMFMTLSRSLVRAAALDGSSPHLALARANRWIARDSESAMFVTLFYGVIEPTSGVMRYSCAGHNPPLLFRAADGTVLELSTPGIALGVLEDAVLGETAIQLAVDDILVCYTDGVTEAINDAEDAFGVPRLTEVVLAHRAAAPDVILAAITSALLAFTGDRPPFDDVTLVVIKRVGQS